MYEVTGSFVCLFHNNVGLFHERVLDNKNHIVQVFLNVLVIISLYAKFVAHFGVDV